MKKILLLVFMAIIAGLSIFVYEAYRSPHVQVALPARHGLTTGSPLLYKTIAIGTITKLKQDEKSNQVALVKVKGDMFSLLHENDSFVVRDQALHVISADQPGSAPAAQHAVEKQNLPGRNGDY